MDGEAAVPPFARNLGVSRTAQPTPRRQKRQRFQKIGFAGAVLSGEHDRTRSKVNRKGGIVSKIGKRKPTDMQGNLADCPVGLRFLRHGAAI